MVDDELLDNDEELGGGSPQERDWQGIGTALLVIMLLCSIIASAVFFFTPLTASENIVKSRLNLTDISSLRYPYSSIRWKDAETIYYNIHNGNLEEMNIHTQETTNLLDHELLEYPAGHSASHDLTYMGLFAKAPNPSMNKDNATVYITIYNLETTKRNTVGTEEGRSDESQYFMEWNPTDNDFVFVQGSHIYYRSAPESNETYRVSRGNPNQVHGYFDWVYEEEIYGNRKALWWSKSGRYLAFGSRDAVPTKTIKMTGYSPEKKYPITVEIPYPKAGERRLPVYTLSIWDKETMTLKQMDVQLRDSGSFHYLFAVSWTRLWSRDHLVVVWSNRWQNQISITVCDYDTAICNLVAEYKYPAKMWAMPEDFNNILYTEDSLFVILPDQKKGNGWQHIAKFHIQQDELDANVRWSRPQFLPLGNFDVSKLVALDSNTNTIFFDAAYPSPGSMQLFAISASASAMNTDSFQCVSCLSPNCTLQRTSLAPDFKTVAISCKGPGVPGTFIKSLVSRLKNPVTTILRDSKFEEKVEEVELPVSIRNETVPLGDGYEARVQVMLPSGQFRKHQARLIPVLVKVYGGPGHQMVTDNWNVDFMDYMTTNHQIAVVKIDGRGSGNRGWNYKSPVYGALGTVEIRDQITAIKEILKRYPYLDSNRLAVFGWSYGGFATAHMVEQSVEGFFKCAVAVAPVSHFKYYDATYTERYMGDAPSSAYDRTDLSKNVDKFKHTKLLLMHGLFDDNVHFQNSAVFMEKLQKQNIDFDLMVYPNQDHSIAARSTFVYGKIERFLEKCFAK